MTEDDEKRLRNQRTVVERYLGSEDSKEKYKTAAGKLGTIRAILQARLFKRDQTYELQCLGIVLGDAFVQELGMEWIMVEDEYGRDPAVRIPGTSIILYPLTMISKRVERGEQVDVFGLDHLAFLHHLDLVVGKNKTKLPSAGLHQDLASPVHQKFGLSPNFLDRCGGVPSFGIAKSISARKN